MDRKEGSKWRKAKLALGLNMCLYVPKEEDHHHHHHNHQQPHQQHLHNHSSSSPSSPSPTTVHDGPTSTRSPPPPSPSSSSSGLRLSTSGPKSSKRTCAICLTTMKQGHGQAIFTAECSHSFHFHCITSNVKHGNQVCPVCRAKWKEIPFQRPVSEISRGRPSMNAVGWARDDAWMTVLRRLPSPQLGANGQMPSPYRANEPAVFDDDETLDLQHNNIADISSSLQSDSMGTIEIKTYPEVSAVSQAETRDNFAILIHLKAPLTSGIQNSNGNHSDLPELSQNARASVDLVTVLDVSGSMSGTKLALLKRAMGFVIQNLGPSDRLSVIAFSSTARRIFPLRRMTEAGKQEALQAVNALAANGGTNIAEALRKAAKVIVERKWKNPVGSVILLSDGQDTYTVNSTGGNQPRIDYKALVPISIHRNSGTGFQIPVHAFGFGADHDAASMHSISEISGGTFSFIEAEGVIQDAFAQCIGGLLSVVVQELRVKIECVHPSLHIGSIKAGSYPVSILANSTVGSIDVGDLYAEEERDFLVTINIPVDRSSDDMSLLMISYVYRDPITKGMVTNAEASWVKIQRPQVAGEQVVSLLVDRQQNRLHAAEAMAEARVAAENGDLNRAVSILENCCQALTESASAKAGDGLYMGLYAELKEMQERMSSRRTYEESGRAYVLSGLSSHSWQRATARGDSTDTTSLLRAYQTPSMVEMVTQSQTMSFGSASSQRKLRQTMSFPAARPQPR
ncbi:hypothetical protein Tsubulata_006390 [Turnera subulata]|uniref:RING-type domain-containing protein n=1 Tax=Turnera subulata TaxID=218843 RepID=A0A9Q0IZL6_9ROSI|nr:hypothetical protein Tsubulata_006390 [Turnera subulata]